MSIQQLEKTVVMTDVAGFTQRMRANEQQTLALLQVDVEIIKRIFSDNDGEIVKIAGDGILALFSDPHGALKACVRIQEELAHSELKHRMAIHYGRVTRADGDVYGDTVNVCSRLEALARPGTVIMSESAAARIREANIGIPSVSGKVRLKGIEGRIGIHCYGKEAQLPKQPNRALQIGVVVAFVAIIASAVGWVISQKTTRNEITSLMTSRSSHSREQSSEAKDIDEMLDQAFDDLWQEIDEYEAVKEEAIAKVDPNLVIDWLNKNPLGKRERGQLELKQWTKVKGVVDTGKSMVGSRATADQIWVATLKNPQVSDDSRKAFAEEFRRPN